MPHQPRYRGSRAESAPGLSHACGMHWNIARTASGILSVWTVNVSLRLKAIGRSTGLENHILLRRLPFPTPKKQDRPSNPADKTAPNQAGKLFPCPNGTCFKLFVTGTAAKFHKPHCEGHPTCHQCNRRLESKGTLRRHLKTTLVRNLQSL